jgi:FixJ family two-component response regulator
MQPADRGAGTDAAVAAHRELVGELAEQLAHGLANRMAVARLTAEVLATQSDLPEGLAARVATVVRAAVAHPVVTEGRLELLVTDVELPGTSGLALAEGLLLTGVPVVVMSGHGGALRRLLPAGARVLDKPFGVHDLRGAVRAALVG